MLIVLPVTVAYMVLRVKWNTCKILGRCVSGTDTSLDLLLSSSDMMTDGIVS